ncbi:competence/damage-inducible protein CinA domain protein [Liberibacter crescens BT-1]|uniref:Competence/damage-inducible protein CinA domain protein n=1 Tax=Liberibacter crescens (strain BT-1) TaxID=1215343 RepID=L0EU81_LIBCB|nr:CinA family protein [Liberibacter crescens]AGA65099.1 competence/damage-inducible protein CinA domain protein [Liberibacter crescens BT-1]AMC13080.1 hypothetical protein RL73_05615 [Liberibacter crescens]
MKFWPVELRAHAKQLVVDLTARKYTIATAESCTGGLISSLLTDIPGASAIIEYGFLVYSNRAKMRFLGVSQKTLETWGAVSFQTALEMAQGALIFSHATFAISATGIAGPGGGSLEKPVGLAHVVAISQSGNFIHSKINDLSLDRLETRFTILVEALDMLRTISQQTLEP